LARTVAWRNCRRIRPSCPKWDLGAPSSWSARRRRSRSWDATEGKGGIARGRTWYVVGNRLQVSVNALSEDWQVWVKKTSPESRSFPPCWRTLGDQGAARIISWRWGGGGGGWGGREWPPAPALPPLSLTLPCTAHGLAPAPTAWLMINWVWTEPSSLARSLWKMAPAEWQSHAPARPMIWFGWRTASARRNDEIRRPSATEGVKNLIMRIIP